MILRRSKNDEEDCDAPQEIAVAFDNPHLNLPLHLGTNSL